MAIHPDDATFTYATESEWDHAAAIEIGAHELHRAWVCTDRDVWHRNPNYSGPAVKHPEED